jgi:hypothetical protein
VLAGGFAIQDTAMKMIFKTALMAATIAGAMSFVPTLANAQIGITLNLGGPGPGYGPCGPGYGACAEGYNPYEGDYYYDPVYFDGQWYHGPYRWRMNGNDRVYWIDGAWRRNEWTGGAYPGSISFRNGGYYRGGRYEGFNDADRINARFHAGTGPNHGPRPEAAPYRGDMNQDRGTMGQDRRDSDDHRGTPRADDQHGGADGPHN